MTMKSNLSLALKLSHHYKVECFDKEGNLKWKEDVDNLVVTTGQNDILNKYYAGSAYTAANYIGLTTGSPTFVAGDTMASHTGWTEYTAYSNATRVAPVWGTASAASITAPASAFNINGAGGTVGGAFLTTNSTIGGTTGILIGEAVFSANRTVASGDTVNVTPTASV
ncbi:MAG: hypothetical protein KGH65_03615 [Candidatus Micrarchaeota archaeon]|nr:hypothetical protein [Candidatus Micrarchaeota archaeon]